MLLLAGSFIYVIQAYGSLPDIIPSHFDAQGKVDGTSSKGIIFLMPLLALFLCFLPLYFIGKVPHVFNYPVKVTEDNAPRLYKASRLFMAIINLETVAIFTYVTWEMVYSATNGNSSFGVWGILFTIVVPMLTIIIFLWELNKLK